MAETVTVESHGVTAEVEPARLLDPSFSFCLARVSDDQLTDDRKLVWYGRMLDAAFGDDEAYRIMGALAAASEGGASSSEAFNEFFRDVLGQVGAKNS